MYEWDKEAFYRHRVGGRGGECGIARSGVTEHANYVWWRSLRALWAPSRAVVMVLRHALKRTGTELVESRKSMNPCATIPSNEERAYNGRLAKEKN